MAERIECCAFVTQIMRNYCDSKNDDKVPFIDGVFDSIYASLMMWIDLKQGDDELKVWVHFSDF